MRFGIMSMQLSKFIPLDLSSDQVFAHLASFNQAELVRGLAAAEFYRMKLPETARIIILRQFQNAARESLERLIYETGLHSRKLAVETIEFPFDLTLELADDLDLSVCLDTGHILVGFSGPITIKETASLDRSYLSLVSRMQLLHWSESSISPGTTYEHN